MPIINLNKQNYDVNNSCTAVFVLATLVTDRGILRAPESSKPGDPGIQDPEEGFGK